MYRDVIFITQEDWKEYQLKYFAQNNSNNKMSILFDNNVARKHRLREMPKNPDWYDANCSENGGV